MRVINLKNKDPSFEKLHFGKQLVKISKICGVKVSRSYRQEHNVYSNVYDMKTMILARSKIMSLAMI